MQPTPSAERALTSWIVPHFQPIVSLADRSVVGYEALARWPDVPDARPDEVFAAAEANGTLTDLDWMCRRAAVEGGLAAGIRRPLTLFVNVEPTALRPLPRWRFPFERFREIASSELQIVVEFTERELLADPSAVITAIESAREYGVGIALDDVGVNPESLVLLPIALPDVVKLDRSVVTRPGSPGHGETTSFVADYAVSTGARVVAEGIETDDDAHLAALASATLGQGYLFGAPEPSPADPLATLPTNPVRLFEDLPSSIDRPSDILDRMPRHVASWATIARVFEEMCALGEPLASAGMLLVSAQHADVFARRFGHRYAAFAEKHTLVGVIGAGDFTIPGVRGPADPTHAFDGEFAMVFMTDHHTSVVVAKDLGDGGPLEDRRYAWCLSHDRASVRVVAECILRRLAPRRVAVGVS
ncbi:EAL domain-containing protein [uncultured Williamsia sp.]|uniref:EAL domain-containing protein n=1 Tax=uncultured Williamsia sp. TaxID=259311 RepID=UPI0026043FE0|nr:EAL domain-containing protein [uncultured Williamsia sp.]